MTINYIVDLSNRTRFWDELYITLPSVLWCCCLGGRKGIRSVKNMGGWWRWALVSPDGVAPSRMVSEW